MNETKFKQFSSQLVLDNTSPLCATNKVLPCLKHY